MREWIVTNGLGGYSSLTYNNTNTRKYHGLLVSSLNPPTERWVFVNNIYDEIILKDKIVKLSDYKPSFSFDYFPSFYYEINGLELTKTVFMQHEKNTTILKYKIRTKKPVTMIHNPILNSRHIYDVNSQRHLSFKDETFENFITAKPSNTDKVIKIFSEKCKFEPTHYWEELFYKKDHERGDSWIDNNVHIGKISKEVSNISEYFIVLTLENETKFNPKQILENEIKRKQALIDNSGLSKEYWKLILSADNFIVKKGKSKSIIAGYHWFGDWGRDTLIALPGLCLVTKRFDDAKKILLNFSRFCKNGLIPNAFMEKDSKAVYNTVDASLWYIDRVFQYMKYTNDTDFLKEIWSTLESVIDGYKNGTDFDIFMDKDFLISHGPGLTWMDVKINDYYPTPRTKKAVEIQALWYNALCIMSNLCRLVGKKDIYLSLAEKVKESFNNQYDKQYDVIDCKDTSVRPNQIFLVSLDFSMINNKLMGKIVNDVHDELFTVFGLRTLSAKDPNYKGSYIGDYHRDMAYHNGTVWPWLIGPFIKSFVKVNKHSKKSREFAFENILKPMFNVFGSLWDGSIYEIFDGDPVYEPRGCISQAWSVSEVLRSWVEDINGIYPEYESFIEQNTKLLH